MGPIADQAGRADGGREPGIDVQTGSAPLDLPAFDTATYAFSAIDDFAGLSWPALAARREGRRAIRGKTSELPVVSEPARRSRRTLLGRPAIADRRLGRHFSGQLSRLWSGRRRRRGHRWRGWRHLRHRFAATRPGLLAAGSLRLRHGLRARGEVPPPGYRAHGDERGDDHRRRSRRSSSRGGWRRHLRRRRAKGVRASSDGQNS
jgi:hypothetical protein